VSEETRNKSDLIDLNQDQLEDQVHQEPEVAGEYGEYGEPSDPVGEPDDENPDLTDSDEPAAKPSKKKQMRMMILGVGIVIAGLVVYAFIPKAPAPLPQEYAQPQEETQPIMQDQKDVAQPIIDQAAPQSSFDQPADQVTQNAQVPPTQDASNVAAAQQAIIDEINALRQRVTKLETYVGKTKAPFYRTKKQVESVIEKKVKPLVSKEAAPVKVPTKSDQSIVAAVKDPVVTVRPISATPTTELSSDVFTLKGVLSGMAWVTYRGDGKMYIVRVGDKLPNGAMVQRIDAIQHYVGTTLGGIQ